MHEDEFITPRFEEDGRLAVSFLILPEGEAIHGWSLLLGMYPIRLPNPCPDP